MRITTAIPPEHFDGAEHLPVYFREYAESADHTTPEQWLRSIARAFEHLADDARRLELKGYCHRVPRIDVFYADGPSDDSKRGEFAEGAPPDASRHPRLQISTAFYRMRDPR